jgi:PmbA protein
VPDSSDLLELCARAVDAAEGDEDLEAYAEETRQTRVRVRGGEVEQFVFEEARGVGIRILDGGRQGYAYVADPDPESLIRTVRAARENARFAEPDPSNVLAALAQVEPLPEIFRHGQLEFSAEQKVQLAVDLERAAISSQESVRKVESADYGDAVSRVAIASTNGGPLEYRRTDAWASVVCLAERDGETQTGFAFRLARESADLEWKAAAEEAAVRAARLLGSKKPKSERLPVVLDNYSATAFLSVLAGALSADAVQKGRSLFAQLVGETVGSEHLSLIDDGRLLDGSAAAPFDDEGVGTSRTPLVERGVLRGFLHNTRTATKAGAASTGNASRGGYRTVPGVSPSNLFVEAGSVAPEDILTQAGRAVYVQEVSGLHSGANPISGEFSVGAVGLRVENGSLGEPLREMTIASTLLEVLKSISAVGTDLRFVGGGLGAPTILVAEMTIGGT